MNSRLLALAAGLLGCLAATPSQASTHAYVEAMGFLAEPTPAAYKPGMLLWVDDLGPRPGLTTILCNSREVVGDVRFVSSRYEGVKYTEQANWPTDTDMSDILQEINSDSPNKIVDRLELEIANVWADTLPDDVLASIPRLSPSCRHNLQMWRQGPRAHDGGFAVIVTSALRASLTCRVDWSPFCQPNVSTSVFTMHTLAQLLGINGGCTFHGRIAGPPQQIGWQHDQGSLGGQLLAIGVPSPGSYGFGFGD